MSSVKQESIIDGPNKWDLVMAFADRQRMNTRKVRIRTNQNRYFELAINALEHEDGSGESFIIKGHAYEVDRNVPVGQIAIHGNVPNPSFKFVGYFHTRSRQGSIKIPV